MASEEPKVEISMNVMWICGNCPALFHEQDQLEVHELLSHQFSCRCCNDSNFTSKDEFLDHFFSYHFYSPAKSVADVAVQCNIEAEARHLSENVLFSCVSCMEEFTDFSAFQHHFNATHIGSTKQIAFQCKCKMIFDNFDKFCAHFKKELMGDQCSQPSAHGARLYDSKDAINVPGALSIVTEPEDVFTTPDLHLDMTPAIARLSVKRELESDEEDFAPIKRPPRRPKRPRRKKVTYSKVEGLKTRKQTERGNKHKLKSNLNDPDTIMLGNDDIEVGEGLSSFSCKYCPIVRSSIMSLRSHIYHKHPNLQKCRMCSFSTSIKLSLGIHIFEEHLYKDRRVKCWYCDETFVSERLIRKHADEKHSSNYQCALCDKSFRAAEMRRTHVVKCHPEVNSCDVCGTMIINTFKLNEHYMKIHTGHKDTLQLKCPDCHRTFARNHLLEDHRSIMHQLSIKCEFCDMTFSSRLRHKAHALKHPFGYKCRLCSYGCPAEETLARHLGEIHSDIDRIPETFDKVVESNVDQSEGKMIHCEFCRFTTACQESFLIHKLKHAEGEERTHIRNIHCCIPNCNRRLRKFQVREFFDLPKDQPRKTEWIRAIKAEFPSFVSKKTDIVCRFHFTKDDLVVCDDNKFELVDGAIPTVFRGPDVTRRPRRPPKMFKLAGKVLQEKPVRVSKVPKMWKRVLSEKEVEGKTSEEIKRLERSCPLCDQFFSRSASLNHHVRLVHNAEDVPLEIIKDVRVCEICAESVSAVTYKLHVEKHGKERTEVCPKCGSTFYSANTLRAHMNSSRCSSAVFVCSYCGKEFGSRCGLHYHVQKEHEHTQRHYQSVTCNICKTVLTSTAVLHRHIKEVHMDKKPVKTCPECGKILHRKMAFDDHMNAFHTKVWSYICKKCNHHFSQKKQAHRHHFLQHGLWGNEKNMAELFTTVPWMGSNRNK